MMFPQRKELISWMTLFMLFCFLVPECNSQGYEQAPTCTRLECPSYTVTHSEKEFEIRTYKDALWVSSPKIKSNSYREAAGKGFLILHDYFQGNNVGKVIINMTAPVLVDVQNKTYYTVHFYVPQKYQNNLPEPANNTVKAVKLPPRKYGAVRRFDGFLNDSSIATQIEALKASLIVTHYQVAVERAGNQFTVAGYNSPHEVENRVNEVILWFN